MAVAKISKCGVSDLKKALSNSQNLQVIDVREPGEWKTKHIEGSKLIPLSKLDSSYSDIDKSLPAYIVCEAGMRAQKAAEKLAKAGFGNLIVVQGGMKEWQAAGYPVQTEGRNVWPIDRQMRFFAGFMVLTGVLLAWLVNPAFIWISGFIGCGLMISAAFDWCPVTKCLCAMPWNK